MKYSRLITCSLVLWSATGFSKEIVHDAEYYILEEQNGEAWSKEDEKVDQALAEFRNGNGGKPPNIFYILIDDIGFGDLGSTTLNSIRGYKTPSINEVAREGMRLSRMYTEPSCTPTRVAFMTGRQPYRNGMGNTSVDISGFGLAEKEVTLAEILSEAGYNTVHIGTWHMGEIREAWPNFQGFDYAAFPIHQQGQLTIFHDDAADEEVSIGIGDNNFDDRFTLDRWLRTDASSMVTGVEGIRGKNVREVHMKPGERWTEAKYHEMNVRYQNQAMEQLRKLAREDKPFFLQYWPLYPLTGPRTTTEEYTTPNGGTYVEKMKLVDRWIGELMAEMDELGIADNTLVIIMGDNGHFTKYSPQSGYTPMIFRGGKGSTTEGGVRVDAFVRWPGMIEPDSVAGDIVHVTDLFTTIARLGNAADRIPADRIIDGIDQTALLLNGETHGRRDYVFLYNINKLEAVVKEQYKLAIPGGNIENAILADFFDLFRDPQEKYPVATEVGAWGGAKFVRMIQRHLARKGKYPDEGPATGMPYDGIDNLRPESKAAVEQFLYMQKTPGM
ncbi:MAG: sulfatase-like hydrolase/transferase [Thiohalobacterales bacterium]|nr:sulfatase-like hydrolase/transferase [Thiohalobacterales bacterium]